MYLISVKPYFLIIVPLVLVILFVLLFLPFWIFVGIILILCSHFFHYLKNFHTPNILILLLKTTFQRCNKSYYMLPAVGPFEQKLGLILHPLHLDSLGMIL